MSKLFSRHFQTNKTFRKEVRHSIKSSLSRFLAIMGIVALGAGFFAGLYSSAPYMRATAENYYDNSNFMDIHLISTMGFTKDDVAAIQSMSNVEGVMPSNSIDISANYKDIKQNIRIHGIPDNLVNSQAQDYINRPRLVKGRFPSNSKECVLDMGKMFRSHYKIGDTIKIADYDEELSKQLKADEFKVVGFVDSSYYIAYNLGSTSIGNGRLDRFIYVLNSSFQQEVYTDLFVTVKGVKQLESFQAEYDKKIEAVTASIKAVAENQKSIRFAEIKEKANKKIEDSQAELEVNKAKAENELNDASQKIQRSEKDLIKAKNEIVNGQNALDQGFAEYNTNKQLLEQKVKDTENDLQKLEEQIAALTQSGQNEQAESLKKQLEIGKATLEQTKQVIQKQLIEAKIKLDESQKTLEKGKAQYEAGKRQLEKGKAEYVINKQKAEEKLTDAQKQIDTGKKEIAKISKPQWYVLDRNTNVGYVSFFSDADRMASIATVFPLIFFLVAALVALTTMTRMVEEERVLIGTHKALGYSNVTIMSKYLLYAAFASILGSAFGIAILSNLLPNIVWNAYNMMYTAPTIRPNIHWGITFAAAGSAVLCTLTATYLACAATLRESPAAMMLPRAPKPGRRILMEQVTFIWNHMSFLKKVTARNLFRFKKRLFMTVIGIAGCTALLLTGFGIKNSVTDIVGNQYKDIYQYNSVIGIASDDFTEKTKALLNDKNYFKDTLIELNKAMDFSFNGKTESGNLIVPKETKKLKAFVALRTRASHEDVGFNKDSVVISEKMIRTLGIHIGDKITIKERDGKSVVAKVTGVTENYIGQNVYLSSEKYQEIFGAEPKYNEMVAKTSGQISDEKALSTSLMKDDNITTVQFLKDMTSQFDDMLTSLNIVIVVLIISSGLLAFIVLYNLTNINVTERQRELATIKVLGFYNKEVSAYIYRETAMLTVIGCIAGLILGVFLHNYVIQTVEIDMIMFSRKIHFMSYVWSALLTAGFAAFVNFVMYFKLKKIDMVESLKSID
ncbi:FtsX-like permease family protein [Paludicola sp. MB14-C6]|uniref:FtsX-like permease family protein n=1 Tax=Paludihabitans sp. MB14-C6 TaxID=3070656 RepID=UPI0027DBAF44|nr:FtsX-like permease family protein [Paludicola sp. MB14-C6]WMJ23604.1 FtsX-like permease family protein [Paludicola sp. MB14-C6]